MKKFILASLAFLVISGFSCGRICGCDIPVDPLASISLVLKNASGDDLLEETTTGSYLKTDIQLYRMEANGTIVNIPFDLYKPDVFKKGQVPFKRIYSPELARYLRTEKNVAFLRLKNDVPLQLEAYFNYKNITINFLIDHRGQLVDPEDKTLFYYIK